VDQHRGKQSPPLPRRQAVGHRGEFYVLPVDAEVQERQPAQCRQIVPQLGNGSHDHAQQQHDGRGRAIAQLLRKTRAVHGLRAFNNRQLVVRITRREALIEAKYILDNRLGRPQHLFAGLFADPMGHLHAPQQGNKPAQVHGQRQT